MGRPKIPRIVQFLPKDTYFIPLDKPKCHMEETILNIEELEAMRLKDIEGLSQEECADSMKISRQTFQNIIDSARKKVAIALTRGNAIKIDGGNYTFNICKYICMNCGSEFEKKYEHQKKECPNCTSEDIKCIREGKFCMKRCKRLWNIEHNE